MNFPIVPELAAQFDRLTMHEKAIAFHFYEMLWCGKPIPDNRIGALIAAVQAGDRKAMA